jgi:type IV secretory pathway VirB10-like protein
MFDPEKLLGGLVRRGLSSRGRRTVGGTGALTGLGLLGVAMGMVESFLGKPNNTGETGSAPPPPPADASSTSPPPPPPGAQAAPPPPPPPPVPTDPKERQEQAVLLIRAMIAAANSDNMIDDEERGRIIRRMTELTLSQEEQDFLEVELAHPRTGAELADKVDSPQTARQVYIASLLAIDIDTAEEVVYLNDIAGRLGISPEEVEQIQDELGLPRS